MLINNLGIGPLQLGSRLDGAMPVAPFGAEERRLFIPVPDARCWYRFTGDTSRIENGSGGYFSARYLYVAVEPGGAINAIQLFTDEDCRWAIIDCLSGLFGQPNMGASNLMGQMSIAHYFWATPDQTVQVYYSDPVGIEKGLGAIGFSYLPDLHKPDSYRLVFRSWAQ